MKSSLMTAVGEHFLMPAHQQSDNLAVSSVGYMAHIWSTQTNSTPYVLMERKLGRTGQNCKLRLLAILNPPATFKVNDDNMSVWTCHIPKRKGAPWEVQRVKCTKCEVEGMEGEVIEHFLYHELGKEEVPYLCLDCGY